MAQSDKEKKESGCGSIIGWIILIIIVVAIIRSCGNKKDETSTPSTTPVVATPQVTVAPIDISNTYLSRAFLYQQYKYAEMNEVELLSFGQNHVLLSDWFEAIDFDTAQFIDVEMETSLIAATKYHRTSNNTGLFYYGGMVDNYASGYGMLVRETPGFEFKILYIGSFKDGVINGYGMQFNYPSDEDVRKFLTYFELDDEAAADIAYRSWLNHVTYNGNFKDGEFSGKGNHFNINAADQIAYQEIFGIGDLKIMIITGEFEKGKLNGSAKVYDYDGFLVYSGGMKNDKRDGTGILYHRDSTVVRYKGEFKNDKFHGQGNEYDESGNVIYSGEWKNDDYA